MEQPIESQEKNIQESNEISTNNNNNSSSKLIIDKNDLPKLKKTCNFKNSHQFLKKKN